MKIDMIELKTDGADSIFVPYIEAGPELVLVDAGYPGMTEQIESGLLEKGLSLANATQIWITHHDHDHVGSLAEIKRQHPHIAVKAGKQEIVCIEGIEVALRLRQATEQQAALPAEAQAGGLRFQAYLKSIAPCKVDEALMPGQRLLDEQVQALDTSGHTKGHVSFYDSAGQTLIAGDLVVLEGGVLKLPFPQYAYDLAQAKRSIEAVAKLPIRRILCCHGGAVTGSAGEMRAMLKAAIGHLDEPDKEKALDAVADMIARAKKAQSMFAAGTAQHSLQENRIHALNVAQALILREAGGTVPDCTIAELERAKAPLCSLISKSEKAQSKLKEDCWQHKMLRDNLAALHLAAELLAARMSGGST